MTSNLVFSETDYISEWYKNNVVGFKVWYISGAMKFGMDEIKRRQVVEDVEKRRGPVDDNEFYDR